MRVSYLKRGLLVFAFQAIAMAAAIRCENTSLQWLSFVAAFAHAIVPFIGYIVVLYNAPMLTDRSRLLKTAALTFFSIAATIGGSVVILVVFTVLRVDGRG